jgi:alpha-ribazole phosphatase
LLLETLLLAGCVVVASERRLVLLRHGTTAWNLEYRYASRSDIPLHPSALETLALVRLAGIERVLVSPRLRALQTVDALAGTLRGLTAEVRDDLRELDFGAFEGMTRSRLESGGLARPFSRWLSPEFGMPGAPGGEAYSSLVARVDGVLAEIALTPVPTLVVTHGYVVKQFLVAAGAPVSSLRSLHVPNGEPIELTGTPSGGLSRAH